MYRLLYFSIFLSILISNSFCQSKVGEMNVEIKFHKGNNASGYFLKQNPGYVINLQANGQITRMFFDTNYQLISSYAASTKEITFDNTSVFTPVFATDLQLEKGVYEVYSCLRNVALVAPDFEKKQDSIRYSLDLEQHEKDEKRLAIIPYSKGLRVLSFSNKHDKLYLYQWSEAGEIDTMEIALPESSLSPDEIKKYSKDARVKYKNSFSEMTVAPANSVSIISNSGTNHVFYSEDKIWILSQTPYYTGYNLLELDIPTQTLSSSNFMINDMRENVDANTETRRIPYAVISGNTLIIRNASNYFFEYLFYDVRTKQKIKEYKAGPDESLQKVLHSDFIQRGTWLSGGDEKKLENEKAFLRKLTSGAGFITVSQETKDSITITTGSLKATSGLAGLIVSIGTGMLGYMANLTIGNYQIIPFLTLYRNKLTYCHSRFSKPTFELSSANNVTSTLDDLLNDFEKRDLSSNSSFLIKKDEKYLVAVYNPETKKIELYSLINDKSP